jgi:hypothetical protein
MAVAVTVFCGCVTTMVVAVTVGCVTTMAKKLVYYAAGATMWLCPVAVCPDCGALMTFFSPHNYGNRKTSSYLLVMAFGYNRMPRQATKLPCKDLQSTRLLTELQLRV